MSALNLSKIDMTAHDRTPVRLVYDQEADILEIFFGANEPATGVEITDHIILRRNQQTKRAVSLLLLPCPLPENVIMCPATEPIALAPNTRVRMTIETISSAKGEAVSFLRTACTLNLDGPPDWSANIDEYLYGGDPSNAG
jgi:hypothetical protein